jgi:hypothetical protein
MSMKRAAIAALAALAMALFAGTGSAKLPVAPMTDEAKAKADEAKAKQAEAAKKDSELLAKYQDKAVDNYRKGHGKAKAVAAAPAKPKK